MLWLLLACVRSAHGPTPIATVDEPAREQLQAACDHGDTEVCVALGRALAQGRFGPPEPAGALRIFEDYCKAGDFQACGLGLLLLRQQVAQGALPANPSQEENFLEHSCTGGIAASCMELGQRWAEKDFPRAQDAWRRACASTQDGYTCGLIDGTWPFQPPPQPELPPPFRRALTASHLSFTLPPHFSPVAPVDNPDQAYQYAIRYNRGDLEVRYVVSPLAPFLEQYAACQKKPGCVSVEPNKMGEATFLAGALNISADPSTVPDGQLFPDVAQRLEFGGTWGKVAVVRPRASFGAGYKGAMIMCLHRDNLGDVLVVALFNEPGVMKEAWGAAMHALRWEEPVGI